MGKQPDSLILQFVSQAWFGSAADYYEKLPQYKQGDLLKQLVEHDLEPLGYYALNEKLPPEYLKDFREKYQFNSIGSLKTQVAFAQLCAVFKKNNIRFAPFKGVDIAKRLFPAAALRSFCDWDVLIHPDDCAPALDVLQQNGWKALEKVDLNTSHYHFAVHTKDNYFLEPHWTFSQFGKVDPRELWEEITPETCGSVQHVLSGELNILQLIRHASFNNYSHLPLLKMLQDAAAIIRREKIDWQKIRMLAKRWNLPYPGDILSVWNEFFPADVLNAMAGDEHEIARYRKLFAWQDKVDSIAPGEWALQRHKGGKLAFILQGVSRMTPQALRKKYKLNSRTFYLILPFIYVWDLTVKFFLYCKYTLFPDKKMKIYQQMCDELEAEREK